MRATLSDRITHALAQTPGLYYRLVLVVGSAGSGKTEALRELAVSRVLVPRNVNLALFERLLELTRRPAEASTAEPDFA